MWYTYIRGRELIMGRKKGKVLSKEVINEYKEIEKRNNNHINITCTKCKRISAIRVNLGNEVLYTEKLKRSYICLLCR